MKILPESCLASQHAPLGAAEKVACQARGCLPDALHVAQVKKQSLTDLKPRE